MMKTVEERSKIAAMYGMSYEEYDAMTDRIVVIYRAIQDAPMIKQSEVYKLIVAGAETKLQAAMMGTALILMCRRTPRETDEGAKELFWEVDDA